MFQSKLVEEELIGLKTGYSVVSLKPNKLAERAKEKSMYSLWLKFHKEWVLLA